MNKTERIYHILGLMSGSSLDGLDLALVKFEIESPSAVLNQNDDQLLDGTKIKWEILATDTIPYSEKWINRLRELPHQSGIVLMKTHTYLGHYMGELVNLFLKDRPILPDFIGSHGHTVYHFPNERMTVQIGDGAALSALTGFPTICDFRTSDVAFDGEGTPLAPIADKLLFPGYDFYLNIGGIANISCNNNGKFIAFDVCTANQAFNHLARQKDLEYDKDGCLGAEGIKNEDLFHHLGSDSYFQKSYPKSLDNSWILQNVLSVYDQYDCSVEDKIRTSYEHLAYQTANAIRKVIKKEDLNQRQYRMLITGGGAFNLFLVQQIQKYVGKVCNCEIVVPPSDIIKYKEALLMALMALLRVENLPNCLKSVTGAMRNSVGGAIYQGYKRMIK
ncbi:MAG: anhydro-N-acetylmuramic acid kinase [Saprospiraceae bacterium]|nr:anhydro-N-acetylmuramic acid kinase [Saprospiraceae bacterium]